jgi:HK97 family phage major capsid protein
LERSANFINFIGDFKVDELRKKWGEVIDSMTALNKKAKDEARSFTAEEKAEYAALESKEKELSEEIERSERLAKLQERKKSTTSEPIVKITREEGEDENGKCIVFRSLGEQLMAVKEAGISPHRRNEKLEKAQKIMRAATGLNESQAADGGFLVQTDEAAGLIKRAYETSVLASRCTKIGISPNSNGLKINAIDESSRANGSRLGGIQAFWENEADAYTGSRPKFRTMSLVLKKLTGLCYATEELLQDASALESVISEGFKQEFAFKLDDAIFRGTGAGQPLGIKNSAAFISQAKESGQTADTIVLNNIAKMRSRLWVRSRGSYVWTINQDCEPQLNVLSLTVGNNSYPVLLPATGISGAPYDTMYGRPVVPTEYSDTLGDLGDVVAADFSQYLLIDKGTMQQAASVHVRFVYDEMTYKFTYRVDGQPLWDKALTPYKGTATVSPFVGLAERA